MKEEWWNRVKYFFDLPDFLTFKATGSDIRSYCSTVCKWAYKGHFEESETQKLGWVDSFWKEIGLEDLIENNYKKIGSRVEKIGGKIENGLSENAAHFFGLIPGTAVGISMIDAHAGGVGWILLLLLFILFFLAFLLLNYNSFLSDRTSWCSN